MNGLWGLEYKGPNPQHMRTLYAIIYYWYLGLPIANPGLPSRIFPVISIRIYILNYLVLYYDIGAIDPLILEALDPWIYYVYIYI